MLNQDATRLFQESASAAESMHCALMPHHGASLLDAGVDSQGSLAAGILLARLCLGDRASVTVRSQSDPSLASHQMVEIQTDHPLAACLGSQYAGWPVQTDDYFAMGSGPMRLLRGREPMLTDLGLSEDPHQAVGVLESDGLPSQDAIQTIARECGVTPGDLHLAVAPSTSIAGSIQVVARSVETALHKLHEIQFDVRSIRSAAGAAPLPPPAKRGDTVAGIGRTNDAILYGATVTLWTDCEDDAIAAVAQQVPSCSSADHGKPFAEIFKQYDYDFYRVDPLLFSPAIVTFHNLRSGRSWTAGRIEPGVLKQSFYP